MTNKPLATDDDDTQTMSPAETAEMIEFTQALLRAFDREIEAIKARARSGEAIDLDELDDNVDLRARFEKSLAQLRCGTFGARAPADRSAAPRGH
jgi:hypothetical protein